MTKSRIGGALCLAAFVLSPLLSAQNEAAFEHRTYRKWSFDLPAATSAPVGQGIPIPHKNGENFAVEAKGTAVAVDIDGDQKTDVTVDADGGVVVLEGTAQSGRPFRYSARMNAGMKGWSFTTAGAQVGTINGQKVQLIDQNLNGRYDDYGVDAMVVGRTSVASFLSKVINVDGDLFEIDVAADGNSVSYAPYTGVRGTLDIHGACETKSKMVAAVVRSTDGRYSFELAKAIEGLKVPAGDYVLHSGAFGLGEGRVNFTQGRSRPMTVAAGEVSKPRWGGRLSGEFNYARQGGEVSFHPDHVWYFGTAGEQYVNFTPLGKSPIFAITDTRDQRELIRAQFPGSC